MICISDLKCNFSRLSLAVVDGYFCQEVHGHLGNDWRMFKTRRVGLLDFPTPWCIQKGKNKIQNVGKTKGDPILCCLVSFCQQNREFVQTRTSLTFIGERELTETDRQTDRQRERRTNKETLLLEWKPGQAASALDRVVPLFEMTPKVLFAL